MPPDTSDLERIQRLSRKLRLAIWILGGLTGLILIAAAVQIIGLTPLRFVTTFTPKGAIDSTGERVVMLLSLILNSAVVLKGLLHFHHLFTGYIEGDVFSLRCIRQIQGLGTTLILAVIMMNITFFLLPLAAQSIGIQHLTEPRGELRFDLIFAGVTIYLIAHVMMLARGLDEQQRLTI